MIKLLFFCHRRSDLDPAAYRRHLLDRHVPLALRHHVGLRHYVVNVVEQRSEGADEIDSVNALWYDSLEAYRQHAFDSPEGRRLVREDQARFLGDVHGYATRELVHRDLGEPDGPCSKWICAIRRPVDLDHESFAERWQREQIPRLLTLVPEPVRLVSNLVEERLAEADEAWDVIAEIHFASHGELAAPGFADRYAAYRVTEHVQR